MWQNELVNFGDLIDFLEWRRTKQVTHPIQLNSAPPNKRRPLLRVYNNGVNLYVVNRKGKFFRLREKLHQGKSLTCIPGVTSPKETITITFTVDSVVLQYCESGLSQSMCIPVGEIRSMYEHFETEKEKVTSIFRGKLISRKIV